MTKIGNYVVSNLINEHSHKVTYTTDVPGENPANGTVPIQKNLLGINLTIDVYGDADTGDPGWTGFGGDYDVKIHVLTPILRVRMGVGAINNNKIVNVRSDALYLGMDAIFNPEAAELPTVPVAATGAATHYFVNLHVPLRINRKDSGYYWYEFDLATEAQYITTVANWTMTSITFRFQNVYTNDTVQTIYFTDGNSGAVNTTSGAKMDGNNGLNKSMTLVGLVITGEQAGTEDLEAVWCDHNHREHFKEDIDDHWSTIKQNTHGKVNRTDFKNTMIILFEPFTVDESTKLYLSTTASQDFQITYLRLDKP